LVQRAAVRGRAIRNLDMGSLLWLRPHPGIREPGWSDRTRHRRRQPRMGRQKTQLDFLNAKAPLAENIVCNPPFNIAGRFMRHAIEMDGVQKVAMIFPTARLNAAKWLEETPLARVWLMTPRPSMPPGHTIAAGEKPSGGKTDFCWLVWTKGRIGPPAVQWLRRDA
jgi:hypothetical protein